MNCLKEFESEDILYHYTKTTTALEHILFNKKLRFSDRINSNDPIEHISPKTLIKIENLENETYDNWDKYEAEIKKRVKHLKQVCFCMNTTNYHLKKEDVKPHEFYGCMKPRMWEQYADNYNGVCFILSKSELLKQLDETYKEKKIKYVNYADLVNKKINIDSKDLTDLYYASCLKKVNELIDKYLFHKHKDYKGENEYRICADSDDDLYINIESALKGIVVSENNSKYFEEKFLEYAEDLKIDIFKVKWKSDGVEVYNLKDWIEASIRNRVIAEGFKKRKLNK